MWGRSSVNTVSIKYTADTPWLYGLTDSFAGSRQAWFVQQEHNATNAAYDPQISGAGPWVNIM